MKTLRLFGIALLTVLMSVGSSSCSKSDDDNNGGGGSSASIGVTGYLKSDNWSRDESTTKFSDGDTIEHTLVRNGNNDYQKYDDRFVVKTLTSNSLVVDWYDNYYVDDKSQWEYGTYYFMK